MDEPVGKLDERFSDPGAEATPWATANGGSGRSTAASPIRTGRWTPPVRVFAVKPAKVLAFGKGLFSQTRYRPS